jgi:F-type H+-transporting ATPase subunit epsilon
MEGKLKFEVATPERLVIDESVDEVVLPSVEGYMGVRPGHAPLLAMLEIGEISYRLGNTTKYVATSGGFVEVLRESVRVLADTAEPAEEIDVERARRSKAKAEELLKTEKEPDTFQRAEVRLKRAISRIQTHEHIG